MIQIFLQRGIDVNIRGDDQWQLTALTIAAGFDKITSLRMLLDNNADPDLKDEIDGVTALMIAAENDYPDILAELLVRGADDKIENNHGKTALQLAEEKNNQDVVRMFTAWSNKNTLNEEMLKAAREGRWRLVIALIRAGADVKTTDEDGNTGLIMMNEGLVKAAREGAKENVWAFKNSLICLYKRCFSKNTSCREEL